MQNQYYRLYKIHLQQQIYKTNLHKNSYKTSIYMLTHTCNQDILSLWRGNVDLQYVVNEIARVKICLHLHDKR